MSTPVPEQAVLDSVRPAGLAGQLVWWAAAIKNPARPAAAVMVYGVLGVAG